VQHAAALLGWINNVALKIAPAANAANRRASLAWNLRTIVTSSRSGPLCPGTLRPLFGRILDGV
jgi:hypothetical protein